MSEPQGRSVRPRRAGDTESDPLRTPLTELTGVRWPVVQTGMGWVAGPRLVTAVAEAGGLDILASATTTLGELKRAVAEVKDRSGLLIRRFGPRRHEEAVIGRYGRFPVIR
jgi:NAD(P)H-dependent flavin oxidoreductase YrpB (nitropropane dioxygenase family)